jgi:pyridoxine 5-phosphate synthase
MLAIATRHRPNACCLVPERRAELTTEGGLDVAGQAAHLTEYAATLRAAGIRVSLFIDPAAEQIEAAAKTGADIVELHTGRYCEAALAGDTEHRKVELSRLIAGAARAAKLGLEVHAGHGLTFDTTPPVAAIPQIVELNIGHFLIAEAIFTGLGPVVARMKAIMREARGEA